MRNRSRNDVPWFHTSTPGTSNTAEAEAETDYGRKRNVGRERQLLLYRVPILIELSIFALHVARPAAGRCSEGWWRGEGVGEVVGGGGGWEGGGGGLAGGADATPGPGGVC